LQRKVGEVTPSTNEPRVLTDKMKSCIDFKKLESFALILLEKCTVEMDVMYIAL